EIMLGANYLTHLCVMRTEHVLNAGGWRSEMDGAQDWDLFLRVIARSKTIRHLPKVLYHWRQAKTSVAAAGMQGKPYAARAQVRCLEEHARAMGLPSLGVSHTRQGLQLAWPLSPEIRVSVVCVSRAANDQLLERAERLV